MSTLAEEMKTHALEAQKFSRKHLVLELDFSEDSLRELERHCDTLDYAIRGGKSPENLDMLTRIWGAYLGESLRRATGAQWEAEESGAERKLALKGITGVCVYPHELIRRRLTVPGAAGVAECYRSCLTALQRN